MNGKHLCIFGPNDEIKKKTIVPLYTLNPIFMRVSERP